MPPLRALEPPHDGAVLLLKPLSGVFDTVSRSHFDRSRMAARLKSRFALDAGVDFLSRLLERAESEGTYLDGGTGGVPQDSVPRVNSGQRDASYSGRPSE